MQETIVADAITTSPEIYLGQKIVVISIFLLVMWLAANYFVNAIKKGKLTLPKFLSGILGDKWASADKSSSYQNYNLEVMQRKVFPDGSELLVLDADGRHLLLSKTIHSGITYITDLKQKPVELSVETELATDNKAIDAN